MKSSRRFPILSAVRLCIGVCSLALGFALSPAGAQTPSFPQQPVRIIVPFAPGGTPDLVARLLGQVAGADFGQRVYVENITGGAGNIAMQAGARAEADGQTILMCTLGCASNLFLLDNLGWDPRKDIAPVMVAGVVPNVLVVGQSLPVKSVGEFLAAARERPGKLTMASSGIGSASHLAGEMFKAMAGLEILHVPYRGSTAALPDIVAGRVDSMIVSLPEALSFIRGGQLRALGVSSAERAAALPAVPTISESGVPGYAVVAWSAMFVPAATPKDRIDILNRTFNKALGDPEIARKLSEFGVQGGGGAPEKASALLQSEIAAWGKLIKDRNIKPN
ncbi:MAG TPA: tripartite tricarboxylate transporter substrate binding protein [Pseudolabrys sp.]|nr:tripartite tricarboxylate transporter substrate binding protein [Pseudolabrys sp.]